MLYLIAKIINILFYNGITGDGSMSYAGVNRRTGGGSESYLG
jgi:hypothetical protein